MSTSIEVSHAESPGSSATRSAVKILVAEGDSQVRRVLRTTLTSAGYVVVEATTGEEALEKVQAEGAVDTVLLDLRMPGIGGLEACRRIRRIVDIPILVTGVLRDRKDQVRASDAGADGYLVKPFGIQDLLWRIHALRRRAAALEPIPTV